MSCCFTRGTVQHNRLDLQEGGNPVKGSSLVKTRQIAAAQERQRHRQRKKDRVCNKNDDDDNDDGEGYGPNHACRKLA